MKLISYHWDCERFQIEAHITHIIYAVRSADVATAPVKLKLVGEVAAGHPFRGKVEAGEAARIFTGGVLPPGADTIVIQENTVRDVTPW
jgi:molybdopterin biosynthesis enzyme